MKLSFAENIKITPNEENIAALNEAVEDEFKKISNSMRSNGNELEAVAINASFGSILRNDVTRITISENRKKDGYVINCETEYKPSVAFWIFCAVDFFLIATLIGFIIGFGATLGLYFYNKSLVEKAVKDALAKVKQNLE